MKLMDFLNTYRITNKEFAAHIGIDPAAVWKVCKEKQIPGLPLACKIKMATGGKVTYEDLMPEEPKIAPIITSDVATSREMFTKLQELELNYKNQIDELQKQVAQLQDFVTSTDEDKKSG